MKFSIVILLSTQPLLSASVTLDGTYTQPWRNEFNAVTADVWSVIQDLFRAKPPLDIPIICHFGNTENPITTLDNYAHPTAINIYLTVQGNYPSQFAYQLSHELGHVMLNPRRTNGIVETICSALAYEVLDRLRDKWAMVTPPGILRGYEEAFKQYQEHDQRERLQHFSFDVQSAVERHDWIFIRRYLAAHVGEQRQLSLEEIGTEHGLGRNIEALGAVALRSAPIDWKRFLNLGDCSTPNTRADPKFRYLPINKSCVARLSTYLCRMGDCLSGQR